MTNDGRTEPGTIVSTDPLVSVALACGAIYASLEGFFEMGIETLGYPCESEDCVAYDETDDRAPIRRLHVGQLLNTVAGGAAYVTVGVSGPGKGIDNRGSYPIQLLNAVVSGRASKDAHGTTGVDAEPREGIGGSMLISHPTFTMGLD